MGRIDLASTLADARACVSAELGAKEEQRPKFATLCRKDALIRDDQSAGLTALAKHVMGRRVVKTERLTENTLIRVAIDLLLAHADHVRGSTEDELRNSVTSTLSASGTSEDPWLRLSKPRASELPERGRVTSRGGPGRRSAEPAESQAAESRNPDVPHFGTTGDPQSRTSRLAGIGSSDVRAAAEESATASRPCLPAATHNSHSRATTSIARMPSGATMMSGPIP